MEFDDNLPDSDEFIAPPFTLSEREKAFLTRNVKAGVFTDLFEDKRYLLLLYKALHPEDASATEAYLTNVTCRSVLANTLYNDLGFFVRNKLVILVEAQSTWSRAIVSVFSGTWRRRFYKSRFIASKRSPLFAEKATWK